MGRQLCGGPICEKLAPFWGTSKHFFKKMTEFLCITKLFKKFCFNLGFSHKEIAILLTGFSKEDDFPKTLGLLKNCFVGRQLCGGPTCNSLAPFWGNSKLFLNRVAEPFSKTELFCFNLGVGSEKVAVPQTGFLKEDDFPMSLGLLGKCFVGRQFFWGPDLPLWGTSKLFFTKVTESLCRTKLFKKFCFNVGLGHS